MTSKPESKLTKRKREEHLSRDRNWRSFPRVPHLLQYVNSGRYYARVKVRGKLIRQSLETNIWSTAQLRLVDFLKQHRESAVTTPVPTFAESVEHFKKELEHDTSLKASSRDYRLLCLQKIERSWPELRQLNLDAITARACKEWAARLNKEIAPQYFNNVIGTLRHVIAAGIKAYKLSGGNDLDNPASELKRSRIPQKELRLPEATQFKGLIKNLRFRSGGWGPRIGDLVEFLAYGGMRIKSEAIHVSWDDLDWERKEIVVRGNPTTGTKNSEIRRVPMIPDMEGLLSKLKTQHGAENATGPILRISRCDDALTRACKELGIPRITHHDLRHLFATRCIESGVDIPTVSRWLGHKDGGALAMRTYGHLRNEHSQQMAQKVKF